MGTAQPRTLIGIDIGGTKTSGALVSESGDLLCDPLVLRTPSAEGAEHILGGVTQIVEELSTRSSAPIDAVGIGSAGVIGADGSVIAATNLLKDWQGTRIKELVQQRMGLPVTVLNDVHAAGLGEALRGAGQEHKRVFVVALGTGIGGAIVHDGVLDIGAGRISGAFGHVPVSLGLHRVCSCGVIDHVEAYASGPSLESLYREQGGSAADLREVEAAMNRGDSAAQNAILTGAKALGEALAGAVNLLDPDVIVIGGGVANMGDAFLEPVREAYRSSVLPTALQVPIVVATLGVNAAIVGSALAADAALS